MKVDVQISFPCEPEEWARLCKIHAMFSGSIQVHVDRQDPAQPFAEQMTPDETRLLDEMSRAAHERGRTPLMDALEDKKPHVQRKPGARKSPTSVRALVEGFLKDNGAVTFDQLLAHVATAKPDKPLSNLRSGIYMAGYQLGITRKEGLWHSPEFLLHDDV